MSKALRQRRIVDLVSKGSIESQDDLRRALSKSGMRVTQATLSRDINDLGLVKTPEGYALPQDESYSRALPSLERLLREFVVDVKPAGQLLLLKTMPGSAQAVAAALDAAGWPEVAGTLAGDDTILVVAEDASRARRAAERVSEELA